MDATNNRFYREKLGRFDHHPDPAMDFSIEVDCLEGLARNVCCGLYNKNDVSKRIFGAMLFNVGGDEGAVKAKGRLRELEKMVADFEPDYPTRESGVKE